MKKFILVVLLTVTPFVNATSVAISDFAAGSTAYDIVNEWIARGVPVNYSEVANKFYRGRCFDVVKKDRPQKMVLAIAKFNDEIDSGPSFPPYYSRKVLMMGTQSINTIEDARRELPFSSNYHYLNLPSENSLLEYANGYYKGSVMKHGPYLVATQLYNYANGVCDAYFKFICDQNGGKIPVGTQVGVCYFYEEM